MASVNKVILVGNLGRDPETQYLPSGDAVCNLSIATSETWKDKNGDKKESTEWHRVSTFGRLAEVCGEYMKKGMTIYIEGRLQTRTYEKNGEKRYSTEIRADRMQMLGGKVAPSNAEEQSSGAVSSRDYDERNKPAPAPEKKAASKFDALGDDIPFN